MLKVYVEDGASAYEQMFFSNGWEITDKLGEADLLQLIGGADVSPSLYGEESHPTTHSSKAQDDSTMELYMSAVLNGIPIAGICRGSQFLSVMGGGKLWQDVNGHATGYGHDLIDIETGTVIEGCSSTHHQQHRPASNAIIIAEAFPQLCSYKEHMVTEGRGRIEPNGVNEWEEQDVESFYYEHIKAIGFQPHPEFFQPDHPCQMYYFDIISKYLKLRGDVCADT